MANAFAEIFRKAAQLNRQDPRRSGNIVSIPSEGELLVCGDIHGNRTNFVKVIDYAALGSHPGRTLVLQEIMHGPPEGPSGQDRSVDLLIRAARLKIDYPRNVLFLLGNHDIAQFMGNEITKEGRGVCKAFTAGVRYAFAQGAPEVAQAIDEFLRSLPLAIRWGRLLLAHSLPSPGWALDLEIFARPDYRDAELKRGGSAYNLTWGRGQTPEQLEQLAVDLDAEFFVLGHRHTAGGFELLSPRAISIASDHEHGYILRMPGGAIVNLQNVREFLKPIAALAKGPA